MKLIHNKYIMDIGGSLTYVSVNMLLHFYQLSPKDKIHIKMSNIDLAVLMNNAKKTNLIFKPKDSELMQARTPSGLHLLWICVEDEPKYCPSSLELYNAGLGLYRKYVLAEAILRKIKDKSGAVEKAYDELKKYNDSRKDEGGAFWYIETNMDEMIIIKNFHLMREITAGVRKANKLLDKAKKVAIEYEKSSLGSSLIDEA
jgi:hypothetical protein